MTLLSPPRVTLAASLAVLAAGGLVGSALVAFYVTAVALVGMLGAALRAYLDAVDEPQGGRVLDVAVPALAGLLTVANAAIRFPGILSGSVPSAAWTLAQAAALLAFAGWVASELAALGPGAPRELLRRVRRFELPSR